MESAVLHFLERNGRSPVPTLAIAKAVCGPDAKASDVNSVLYSMLGRNLVQRICENKEGKKPHWVSTRIREEEDKSNLSDRILEYLREIQEPVSTKKIAKDLLGPSAKPKDVNPILYNLSREGLVEKEAIKGIDPYWFSV